MLIGKNKLKMFKRALCLIFAFLFSIESFAAVVSDNDGSAFITKAEFDSLKNNFQSQIDSYNTGIDSKIDTAIANYLSGIKVDHQPVNLLERLRNAMGEPWLSNTYSVGNNTITTKENITLQRHFTYNAYDNIIQSIYWQTSNAKLLPGSTDYRLSTKNFTTGDPSTMGWWWNLSYSTRSGNVTGDMVLAGSFMSGNSDVHQFFTESDRTTAVRKVWDSNVVWSGIGWNRPTSNWDNWSSTYTSELTNHKENVNKATTVTTNGSGSYYEYYKTPSGNKTLRSFFTEAYPVFTVNLTAHTYKSFIENNRNDFVLHYGTETGMSDSTVLSYTIPDFFQYGIKTYGDNSKVIDDSEHAVAYAGTTNIYQVQTDDGIDYGQFLIGKVENNDIYAVSSVASLESKTLTTITADKTKNTYIHNQLLITGQKGCNQNLTGCELKYKSVKLSPETFKISDFINEYVTGVAGETTYLGGGIPIIKTMSDDQKINVRIKFKSRLNGSATNGNVRYMFSNKQFNKGNIASGATNYATGSIASGTELNLTFDVAEKGNIWCNFYSETNNVDVAIDTITIKLVS